MVSYGQLRSSQAGGISIASDVRSKHLSLDGCYRVGKPIRLMQEIRLAASWLLTLRVAPCGPVDFGRLEVLLFVR